MHSTHLLRSALALAGASAITLSPLQAQVASRIISEGDALTGFPGESVDDVLSLETNSRGGYAVHVRMTGSGNTNVAWGSVDGGPATALHQEGSFFGHKQNTWGHFGLGLDDNGQVAHTAFLMWTGKSSMWRDGFPLALEGNPSPIATYAWGDVSNAAITCESGEPYFVGELVGALPTSEISGLFLGTPAKPLLLGGASIQFIDPPLAADPVGALDFDVSDDGAHWVAVAQLDDLSHVLVANGLAVSIEGRRVRTGQPLPPSFGPGKWGVISEPHIDANGCVVFLGRRLGTADTFIVRDGAIVHRTGDIIDGSTVFAFKGLHANEKSEIAYRAMVATNIWAIGVEGSLILHEGEQVDMDRDGVVEPWATVASLDQQSVPGRVRLGERGGVAFQASIDILGTPEDPSDDRLGFYRVAYTAAGPNSYCHASTSGGGCMAEVRWGGVPSESDPMPCPVYGGPVETHQIGSLVYGVSGSASIPFLGGTLCVAPPLRRTPPRLPKSLGGSGCSGTYVFDFNARIQSGIDPTLGAGTEVCVQWFYRDPRAPGGFAHSNASRFVVRP